MRSLRRLSGSCFGVAGSGLAAFFLADRGGWTWMGVGFLLTSFADSMLIGEVAVAEPDAFLFLLVGIEAM